MIRTTSERKRDAMGKFKVLGMMLLAMLVLSSTASAANYTALKYPTTATGESGIGNGTFQSEAGTTECRTHFEATLTGPSSQLTVKTNVPECAKAFGFVSATVSMGSCDYLFTEATSTGPSTWKAPVDIVCTNPSEPMTVTASTCKITFGSQSPGGGANITNTAAGDVSVQVLLEKLNYTVVQDGFLCPFSGTGLKTDGKSIQHSAITFDSTNGTGIHVG
jgi:hypothetical protein